MSEIKYGDVVEIPWQDVWDAVKSILNFIDRHKKPIPIKTFFRNLERKLKTKLAPDYKDELFEKLDEKGRIIKDEKGKILVTHRSIDEYIS